MTAMHAGTPRFGFVVLHYLVDEVTAQCVESIRCCCANDDYEIVIVDNDSANGSYERLLRRYDDAEHVTMLHNAHNEGFARGNNVGYEYCRRRLRCDYIVTINNDAFIDCDRFVELCVEDYRERHCGVIGPDIVSGKDGSHANPVNGVYDSPEKIRAVRKHIRRNLLLLHLHLDKPLAALKRRLHGTPSIVSTATTGPKQPDKVFKLHGSCLVFTPAFVEHFGQAFDPGTFLYLEEDILYMRCRQAGLTMYFDPRILVRHAEDVSTDHMTGFSPRRKQMQYLQRHRESLKVLERYVGRP